MDNVTHTLFAATLAVFCFGAGHGGAFAVLSLPATATRQLLVPAAIAIFFTARTRTGRATLAVIFGGIALSHPTYAIFLLIPLLVVLRWDWLNWLVAAVPAGLVLLWLKPIVDETISHNPQAGELRRGLVQYQDQLVIDGPRHFRIAPEIFGRTGAVAVATLVLLPLLAFAIPPKITASVARPACVRAVKKIASAAGTSSCRVAVAGNESTANAPPWPAPKQKTASVAANSV